MIIYVAGASAEVRRCEMFMRELRARGHEISFDWTAEVRKARTSDDFLTPDQCRVLVEKNTEGHP